MKYLMVLLVMVITGCATSNPEYNQGISQEEGRAMGAEVGIIADTIYQSQTGTRHGYGYQVAPLLGQAMGRRSERSRRIQFIEGRRTHINYPMGTPSVQEVERYYSQFDDH